MKYIILLLLFVLVFGDYYASFKKDKYGHIHGIYTISDGRRTDYNYNTHKTIRDRWK